MNTYQIKKWLLKLVMPKPCPFIIAPGGHVLVNTSYIFKTEQFKHQLSAAKRFRQRHLK